MPKFGYKHTQEVFPTVTPVVVDKTNGFSKDSGGFLDSCFSFSCLLSQLITGEKEKYNRA